MAQMTAAQAQAAAIQNNMAARQLCIQQGVDMCQQIFTTTSAAGPGAVINVPCRNVGLVKRFWVEVAAIVSGTAAGPTHTLTPFGPANFFSTVILSDLSNQQRINTAGWHLTMISSVKRRRPFGAAFTSDTPFGFGNNFTKTIAAPASITTTATANNLFAMFEVPVSYSDMDLRGAIYANVYNATYNLQLTVNGNMFAASGADPTLAVYRSSSATIATMPSFTVTVYQNYLDQLPFDQNGQPILPAFDISTAYMLNNTAFSGLVANQANPFQYANFREFMSTSVIFDNAGALNTGSDLTRIQLQSANFTNIFDIDPNLSSLQTRLILGDDAPAGTYYFDHRHKPISTEQYGNMQLVFIPNTISAATASFLFGYEALALIGAVSQAGSLPGT